MSRPSLLVIAGCNGSGKSTFAIPLAGKKYDPFDYDVCKANHYHDIPEFSHREEMADNRAWAEFENKIELALKSKSNFCYETNFNHTPMHWPNLFQSHGYDLRMVFLALNSIEEAKKRVQIRVQNGGHYVSEREIEDRYRAGFLNLQGNLGQFKSVDVFDSSDYGSGPRYVLSVSKGNLSTQYKVPQYLKDLLPKLFL
jgi:predicted ABC-type ATPase